MAKKDIYDHVGSQHFFKKRPPEDSGEWIFWVGGIILALVLIGQCAG